MDEKQLKMFEGNVNVLVNFPADLAEDLTDAAKELNWSRNKLIRFLCEHGLENLKSQIKLGGK